MSSASTNAQSARAFHHVSGRLSLRPPQSESLSRLVRAIESSPELLTQEQDVAAILSTLKAEFPTLADFEREFPSLCFALATGVGKTRLMGAFIAYLHLAHDAPVQDEAAVRGALALFGSTSPSYLILQSLDACNADTTWAGVT